MSNAKTKKVYIHSISRSVEKQMQILLNIIQHQQQQEQQEQQQQQQQQQQVQQNLHSQSSNQIDFSHSDVSLNTKNSEKQNPNHENLLQFFAALQKLLETINTYTSQRQNEKHNAHNLNLQNTDTPDLLLQNNTPSLYPNNNNYYYYTGKQTNQKKNSTKNKKILHLYKKNLIHILESLNTILANFDASSCENNNTYLYQNNTNYYNSQLNTNKSNQSHYNTELNKYHDTETTHYLKKKPISSKKTINQITVPKNHIMNNTDLYGKITEDKNNEITNVTLYRHKVALTQEEINNQYKEKNPIKLDQNKMFRCPLESCEHKPLNTYSIETNLLQHCEIYHNRDNKQYLFYYQTQHGWTHVSYPPILLF